MTGARNRGWVGTAVGVEGGRAYPLLDLAAWRDAVASELGRQKDPTGIDLALLGIWLGRTSGIVATGSSPTREELVTFALESLRLPKTHALCQTNPPILIADGEDIWSEADFGDDPLTLEEIGEVCASVDPLTTAVGGASESSPSSPLPKKAWLVRAAARTGEDAIGDRDVVEEFLDGGFVAIGWADAESAVPGMGALDISDEVQKAYPDKPPGWWRTSTGNLNSFLNRIEPGHLVLTVDKDRVFVGRVIGPYSFDPDRPLGTVRRWGVEWLNADHPASRKHVKVQHPGLYARLRSWLTVTELTDEVAAVASLIGPTPPSASSALVSLPPATDELASALHIPVVWLQSEVIDLLSEKRQVVFYGPPGTGKTLIAQRIAEHITGDPEAFELVQFHPSFSYEDFFEGYRPVQTEGGVGIAYSLTPGPLRRLAERASANPAQPHVLIVDEINRGNVPKIFGELLFLLEYRDEQIPLMYSNDTRFGLPKNLFIIATMNTADRSIALVDAALRRRFYFVPFLPGEAPIAHVLGAWLASHGHGQEAADLLKTLNARIGSDDIAIGPSYFMTSGGPPNLERVWKHAILPLLEEHFFGTGKDVEAEFGLSALRAYAASEQGQTEDSVEESNSSQE